MPFSEDDRRALEHLDRQLSDDADIDDALRSLPRSRHQHRSIGAVVAIVVATIAMFVLLAVSFVASFVAFLVVLVATGFVVRSGFVQRGIDSIRNNLTPSNSDKT